MFSKSKKEVLAAVAAVKKETFADDKKKVLKEELTSFFELLSVYEDAKKIKSVETVTITGAGSETFTGKIDEAFGNLAKYIKDEKRTTADFEGFKSLSVTFKYEKAEGMKTTVGGLLAEMKTVLIP